MIISVCFGLEKHAYYCINAVMHGRCIAAYLDDMLMSMCGRVTVNNTRDTGLMCADYDNAYCACTPLVLTYGNTFHRSWTTIQNGNWSIIFTYYVHKQWSSMISRSTLRVQMAWWLHHQNICTYMVDLISRNNNAASNRHFTLYVTSCTPVACFTNNSTIVIQI